MLCRPTLEGSSSWTRFVLRRRVLAAVGALPIGSLAMSADGGGLRIFAAASLKELLQALDERWVRQGNLPSTIALSATPMLVRQLEQGARADLVVTADAAWMDRLEQAGRLRPGSRGVLAGNRLVLIAPVRSAVDLRAVPGMPIAAALQGGRLALADVNTVPAGRYARAALQSLGVWASVSGQLAQTEHVRAALALVAREEAPLGITYASDARLEPRVRVVAEFDRGLHPPIVYPMAVLADSRHPQAAAMLAWWSSEPARGLAQSLGFLAPPPSATPASQRSHSQEPPDGQRLAAG